MNIILDKSAALVRNVSEKNKRYLFDKVLWGKRLIGIKGARGTGKTTLLLQKLKALKLPAQQASYWSLDDLFFTDNSLAATATQFYQEGGRILFLDEVHKYPNWSQHIKNLYDQYKDLQLVFSGSSIIDLAREEVDLSRRALMYTLVGMSYREYLNFKYGHRFDPISLQAIIKNNEWHNAFPPAFRPLEFFNEYLQMGYYPYSLEDGAGFFQRLQQVIRIIVENDMAALKDFDIRNAQKMLQLLYILSANVPFKPNISELARKSDIHRNTITSYLNFLEQAQLIRLLNPAGISVSTLQKPEKIYLNNTNLAFAIGQHTADKGNLRETFFASQLSVMHKLILPKQGDFMVDDNMVFEVGGKGKSSKQIKSVAQGYVVQDDQDFPVKSLPLWVFGFLY